jgi:hypothetical protein
MFECLNEKVIDGELLRLVEIEKWRLTSKRPSVGADL